MARNRRDEDSVDEDDDTPAVRPDAWVGLVAISTVALALAATFLFLDSGEIPAPPAVPNITGGDGLIPK